MSASLMLSDGTLWRPCHQINDVGQRRLWSILLACHKHAGLLSSRLMPAGMPGSLDPDGYLVLATIRQLYCSSRLCVCVCVCLCVCVTACDTDGDELEQTQAHARNHFIP